MKTVSRDSVGYYRNESVLLLTPDINPSDFPPAYNTPEGPEYLYSDSFEEKTDQPKGVSRKTWKDFEHYKVFRQSYSGGGGLAIYSRTFRYEPRVAKGYTRTQRFGVVGASHLGSGYAPFGEPGFPIAGLPKFHDKRPDGGFVPPPANLSNLVSQSLKTMMPVIKAELSAVNFLLELKDFKSLPQTIAKMYKFAVRGTQTLRRALRATRGYTPGADAYLQAQFNILPLLSDISGIHAALSRTERRINDLVTRAGRVRKSHFGFNWVEYADYEDQEGGWRAWPDSGPYGFGIAGAVHYHVLGMRRRVLYEPSIFHAELEYNYNYTQYQIAHAQLLGYLDAFGVNLNPSIIWNAIPWTFLIDWVVGVGRFLDQFKKTNMEPQINIRNYLWSIKRTRHVHTTMLSNAGSVGDGVGNNETRATQPRVTEESYRRQIDIPPLSSLTASGLTPREVSLAAALVIARRRRPTTRPRRA